MSYEEILQSLEPWQLNQRCMRTLISGEKKQVSSKELSEIIKLREAKQKKVQEERMRKIEEQ